MQQSPVEAIPFSCFSLMLYQPECKTVSQRQSAWGGWLLKLAWTLEEKPVKLYPWSTHNLNWRKQALASMASQRFALQCAKSTISSKAQFCWHNCIYGITRDFASTATAVWKKTNQTHTSSISLTNVAVLAKLFRADLVCITITTHIRNSIFLLLSLSSALHAVDTNLFSLLLIFNPHFLQVCRPDRFQILQGGISNILPASWMDLVDTICHKKERESCLWKTFANNRNSP